MAESAEVVAVVANDVDGLGGRWLQRRWPLFLTLRVRATGRGRDGERESGRGVWRAAALRTWIA